MNNTNLSPEARRVIEKARAIAEKFYKEPFADVSLSTITQGLSDIESAFGQSAEIRESVKSVKVAMELAEDAVRDGRLQDALNGAAEAGCRWMALLRKVAWPRGNGRPGRKYESVVLEVVAEGRIKQHKEIAGEVLRRMRQADPHVSLELKTILNQIPKILAKNYR